MRVVSLEVMVSRREYLVKVAAVMGGRYIRNNNARKWRTAVLCMSITLGRALESNIFNPRRCRRKFCTILFAAKHYILYKLGIIKIVARLVYLGRGTGGNGEAAACSSRRLIIGLGSQIKARGRNQISRLAALAAANGENRWCDIGGHRRLGTCNSRPAPKPWPKCHRYQKYLWRWRGMSKAVARRGGAALCCAAGEWWEQWRSAACNLGVASGEHRQVGSLQKLTGSRVIFGRKRSSA